MRNNVFKHLLIIGLLLSSIVACSVKKDKFLNRNFHAVTTEYNILYNGNLALTTGLNELKTTYNDNFWDILTIERMPKKEKNVLPGQSKNANFERAEEKAVKAIQKHAMNIGGAERNPQMDEAYLLLAKARYYENRFIPALEALNYILYKHKKSDKIYTAKIWKEKINIRLNNDEIAIKNLKELLKNNEINNQDFADANAMLTQAYINTEAIDSAVTTIKIAKEKTKVKEEKARYSFILGQLYNTLNFKDSAYFAFQEVIDMKRKAPRRYTIQAHAQQALQFDYTKGDTVAFLEKINKLIADRENRPFLDILYHQKGIFYTNFKQDSLAIKNYNKSLRAFSQDTYLLASNYRNIAQILFDKAQYKKAGMYYDSTLLKLEKRTREYRKIKKKRENLVDVIKYEDIAQRNDSILTVVAMTEPEKNAYFLAYIEKLKKLDEQKALLEEERKQEQQAQNKANNLPNNNAFLSKSAAQKATIGGIMPPRGSATQQNFYFYNSATVSYGKIEFEKKWGNRELVDNWRLSIIDKNISENNNDEEDNNDEITKTEEPKYTLDYYLKQLPENQSKIDSIGKERNLAYYQLGLIYKEKFKEYELAVERLEKLLQNNPEERLILPSKYNLYKIYSIINPKKADSYKQQILTDYPDSRYAQIILNPQTQNTDANSPKNVFNQLYKQVEKGELREAYTAINAKTKTYFGDEIVPKFELLKAKVAARLKGIKAYKENLNYLALTYPNTEEGKEAALLLQQQVPILEKLTLSDKENFTSKIIFPKQYTSTGNNYKELLTTLNRYIENTKNPNLKISVDIYDENTNFVVLHGLTSKEATNAVLSVLKNHKMYKIKDEAYVIATHNYTVVQAKKDYPLWLTKYSK